MSDELIALLIRSFDRATSPTGTRKTLESARTTYSALARFARLLAEHTPKLAKPSELAERHVRLLSLAGEHRRYQLVSTLRSALRGDPELTESFLTALFSQIRRPSFDAGIAAYSAAEFRQIMDQSRERVRAALARVREARAIVGRATATDSGRASLLKVLHETGSVESLLDERGLRPKSRPRVRLEAYEYLFPSRSEVAALFLLIVGTTGHNPSTVAKLMADHSTSSGGQNMPGDVIFTRTSKPRRGPGTSEMTAALQNTPDEDPAPPLAVDDLRTAAGLYTVALELCADLRRIARSSRLLLLLKGQGSILTITELQIQHIGLHLKYLIDGKPETVRPTSVRQHYLELTQRPVDHTEGTLASTYLRRNKTAAPSYRHVVGDALEAVVREARGTNAVRLMGPEDRLAAIADPDAAARALGLTLDALMRVLGGESDTVATACTDHTSTPFERDHAGRCIASFLLCLGCPCALSEPRHHPIQAFLWLTLEDRRQALTPDEWDARYGPAFAQLTDLLQRQHVDVSTASAAVSGSDKKLVGALVDGRLEIR